MKIKISEAVHALQKIAGYGMIELVPDDYVENEEETIDEDVYKEKRRDAAEKHTEEIEYYGVLNNHEYIFIEENIVQSFIAGADWQKEWEKVNKK